MESWIYTEYMECLNGGGQLLIKGYKCAKCGFFRRKRFGKSKFCEDCGTRMKEGGEE